MLPARSSSDRDGGGGGGSGSAHGGYSSDSSVRGVGGISSEPLHGTSPLHFNDVVGLHGTSPLSPHNHLPDAAIAALYRSPYRIVPGTGRTGHSPAHAPQRAAEQGVVSADIQTDMSSAVGRNADNVDDDGHGAVWQQIPPRLSQAYGGAEAASMQSVGEAEQPNGRVSDAAHFVEQVMAESERYKGDAAAAAADAQAHADTHGGGGDDSQGQRRGQHVYTPHDYSSEHFDNDNWSVLMERSVSGRGGLSEASNAHAHRGTPPLPR